MVYRIDQGRILRVILFLLLILAAGNVLWAGGSALRVYLGNTHAESSLQNLVAAIENLVIGASVLIGGVIAIWIHPRSAQFLIEVEGEMARVIWPTGKDTTRFTIILAIMVAVLAGLIFVIDNIFGPLQRWFLQS